MKLVKKKRNKEWERKTVLKEKEEKRKIWRKMRKKAMHIQLSCRSYFRNPVTDWPSEFSRRAAEFFLRPDTIHKSYTQIHEVHADTRRVHSRRRQAYDWRDPTCTLEKLHVFLVSEHDRFRRERVSDTTNVNNGWDRVFTMTGRRSGQS